MGRCRLRKLNANRWWMFLGVLSLLFLALNGLSSSEESPQAPQNCIQYDLTVLSERPIACVLSSRFNTSSTTERAAKGHAPLVVVDEELVSCLNIFYKRNSNEVGMSRVCPLLCVGMRAASVVDVRREWVNVGVGALRIPKRVLFDELFELFPSFPV